MVNFFRINRLIVDNSQMIYLTPKQNYNSQRNESCYKLDDRLPSSHQSCSTHHSLEMTL
jgi:hypothetical protein